MLFTSGMFALGMSVGFPINTLVERLPAFLERQWFLDSSECLGLPATDSPPARSLSLLPDRVSARVILTVMGTSLLSAWAAWHYGVAPTAVAAVFLTWGLLTMSLIDLDHQLLPDILVLPLLWLGLIVNSFGLFTTLPNALWGAVVGYLVLWALRRLSKLLTGTEGMGQGDLKLLAMLGAWGGWQILPATLLMSSLVGVVVGVTLVTLGKINRTTPIPFGPYLACAGWLSLLYTPDWASI